MTDGRDVLQDTEFKKANKDELRGVFKYLEFCLQQVVKDNELGALQQVMTHPCAPAPLFYCPTASTLPLFWSPALC